MSNYLYLHFHKANLLTAKYVLLIIFQLNVPLNLPQAKITNTADAQISIYDDVPIPLRIHDCSLNILVLMQSTGLVYICHYYFYQVYRIIDWHFWQGIN